jgi:hypothetical protein
VLSSPFREVLRPLIRALGEGCGGGFSPAMLFTAGEQGGWWDPSDLSTMYQDSAGTTPVTAVGQPVGMILDKRLGAVRGAELVPSTAFTSTAGWVTTACTVAIVGGELELTATATGICFADFAFPGVVAGDSLELNVNARNAQAGTSSFAALVQGSATYGNTATSTGDTAIRAIRVAAAGGNATLRVRLDATVIGQKAYFRGGSAKPLPGNHRTQSTAASRPTLSGRYNLLTSTEDLTSGAWTKEANGTATLPIVTKDYGGIAAPDGTFTAQRIQLDKGAGATSADRAEVYQGLAPAVNNTRKVWARTISGTASVVLMQTAGGNRTVTETWQEFSLSGLTSERPRIMLRGDVGSSNTADILVWHPDLRADADASLAIPSYQRVNTATDYDTAGFPLYLSYDGVDDWMQTASVDFSGTDKMTVIAGVHKASDAATALVCELGTGATLNRFNVFAPVAGTHHYRFNSTGSVPADAGPAAGYSAPHSAVLTGIGDISGDVSRLRINGAQVAETLTDQGTGSYRNDILYFGRRGGTTLPFNGREYGTLIRGAATDAALIARAERNMGSKMGVTW